MGSLHNYRRWLKDFGMTESDPKKSRGVLQVGDDGKRLSLLGHAIAGESCCQWQVVPSRPGGTDCLLVRLLCVGMFAGFSK